MGSVYAEIELINSLDLELAKKHIIGEEEIKRMRIQALVDTGAMFLCINENIQEILQFPLKERNKRFTLANGHVVECDLVAQVELRFKNRSAFCSALVLPGGSEPLLGVMPLEEMDVLINPLKRELIVNPAHPDFAVLKLGGLRPC
jgi:clan AA aspartic protease